MADHVTDETFWLLMVEHTSAHGVVPPPSCLAEVVGLHRSNASRRLQAFVERGLLEQPWPSWGLAITPEGHAYTQQLKAGGDELG